MAVRFSLRVFGWDLSSSRRALGGKSGSEVGSTPLSGSALVASCPIHQGRRSVCISMVDDQALVALSECSLTGPCSALGSTALACALVAPLQLAPQPSEPSAGSTKAEAQPDWAALPFPGANKQCSAVPLLSLCLTCWSCALLLCAALQCITTHLCPTHPRPAPIAHKLPGKAETSDPAPTSHNTEKEKL